MKKRRCFLYKKRDAQTLINHLPLRSISSFDNTTTFDDSSFSLFLFINVRTAVDLLLLPLLVAVVLDDTDGDDKDGIPDDDEAGEIGVAFFFLDCNDDVNDDDGLLVLLDEANGV